MLAPRLPVLLIALLAPAAALAGCIGGDEPSDAATVDRADAKAAAGSASASASGASASAAAASEAAATPEGTAAAPAQPVATPFAWDGNFATGFCVPMGPNSCTGQSTGRSNAFLELEAPGVLQSIEGTLTWTAVSPLTETLNVAIVAVSSCGENCHSGRHLGDAARGVSPLAFSTAGLTIEEGEMLQLYVFRDNPLAHPAGLPIYGYVSHEQAFHVEGVLTSLA